MGSTVTARGRACALNPRAVEDAMLNIFQQKDTNNVSAVTPSRLPIQMAIREGRLTVGPELAARILAETRYEGQRPVNKYHVMLLADSMRRGRWSDGSQIAFARLKGTSALYLINGQHRMVAVQEVGAPIEVQVLIQDVDMMDDVSRLYYRFDTDHRKRTTSEKLNAAGIAEHHGLSKTMARAVYEAVALIGNSLTRPQYQNDPIKARSTDARLAAAREWWAVGKEYEDIINVAPTVLKKKLLNQGVVAVGLVTLQYRPEMAPAFWRGIAENDGLRKGDPRHTLVGDMMARRLNAGSGNQAVASAALAWNAWFERRQLKILKVYPDAPVRLAGTPFDGKRKGA